MFQANILRVAYPLQIHFRQHQISHRQCFSLKYCELLFPGDIGDISDKQHLQKELVKY